MQSLSNVAAIAALTVRDALRQKLAVNLLVFALVLIAVSLVLSELTFGEQYRIISDLALTSAGAFGTLIAVFLGANLVAGEIQRKTLYPVLAKPVSRTQYLLGRYGGLVATLTLNLLVMAVSTIAVLALHRGGFGFLTSTPIALAFVALGAQLAMVAAIALVFSTFTNATLAAIATLALTVAGHLSRDAMPWWRERVAGRVLAHVIPNLAALDFKVEVVYEQALAAGTVGTRLGYAVLYAATMLAIAAAIFGRRDLR
jgi:Cu-processing system permease protein